ncbi:NAD(+) diphosphatase [Streptomyces filamentosus]|uniref:NAD(+) diphosphatase n=1 Tax=Streptomyces filamentosus TaxID=67294 RepID=UPI0012399E49|nr:NAD(+) diphosphatase [Streptomyces filamentosus]KAA6217504.1 NAD(+) diphosphatase [Streptomyces filamentosus]
MTGRDDAPRVVAVDGDTVLLRDGAGGPELAELTPPPPAEGQVAGTDPGGRPYLAVPRADVPPGTRRARLMDVLDELPPVQAAAALRAVGFHQWVRASPHCPRCGAPAALRAGGRSRRCSSCAAEHHPRTDPAVMMSVTDDRGRLLLARRTVAPPGRMSPPAGFVEPGETAEEAAVRELLEEVGVRAAVAGYVTSQAWPFPGSLMLAFDLRAASARITVDGEEITAARWFTREELAAAVGDGTLVPPPRGSLADRLVGRWYGPGYAGLTGRPAQGS